VSEVSEVSVVVNNYCTWDPCSVRLGGGVAVGDFIVACAASTPDGKICSKEGRGSRPGGMAGEKEEKPYSTVL
jgi:hypothetical protein